MMMMMMMMINYALLCFTPPHVHLKKVISSIQSKSCNCLTSVAKLLGKPDDKVGRCERERVGWV